MEFQKNNNEQIPVGRFCGDHAMGAQKTEMLQKKHRPTELFTSFEDRTKPAFEDEMCPRWTK